ncbi:MAG: AlpA family phage regulatory protein [Gallionellaceae bacterium]|jgi:prophage regulatory protein
MSTVSVLRKPEVEQRTGLSPSSIDRLEAAGNFPKRMQLSPNTVGWLSSELDEWIKGRPRGEMVPGLDPESQVQSLKKQISATGAISQTRRNHNALRGGDVDQLETIANNKIAGGKAKVLGFKTTKGEK